MDNTTENNQQKQTVDEMLMAQREKWTKDITELNEMMKTLVKVDELMNIIYSKRQEAVDYYYAMNGVILKQSKEYKALYNQMFNNIKINGYNGMRFTSDQGISRQVEVDLQDKKEVIDLLVSQNAFIKETISTIDNIIFAIKDKIKIKEMLNGMKF
jgi:hypothetical protein